MAEEVKMYKGVLWNLNAEKNVIPPTGFVDHSGIHYKPFKGYNNVWGKCFSTIMFPLRGKTIRLWTLNFGL